MFARRLWGGKEEKSDMHSCYNPTGFSTQEWSCGTSSWVLTAGGQGHLGWFVFIVLPSTNWNDCGKICLELYLNGLLTSFLAIPSTGQTGCKRDIGHNFKSNWFDNKTIRRGCLFIHRHSLFTQLAAWWCSKPIRLKITIAFSSASSF